jgi:dihydrofolate synthase/folylpolyglutamate synthase
MTEYQRTVEWLYALEAAKGMDFKLERVALALQRLGDPHRSFPSLHIAGTNGKGSVAAMLHAVLGAAGYRTGLYISPHLVELTERIRVGGAEISRPEVVALAAEIRAAAAARGVDLTFFEFVTVMAFMHFARQAVDVAVVEVGLGGRLDATNVVDPAAAVITTIGLDHMQWLGDTLPAIAAEKGGIIKPGRPLVLGKIPAEAARRAAAAGAQRGAAVIEAGRDYRVGGAAGNPSTSRSRLAPARHATRSARCVSARQRGSRAGRIGGGPGDPAGQRRRGAARLGRGALARSARRGRHGPLTILDGAHNVDGVAALVRELPALLGGRPMHLLFAVMGDKDWRPMVERLAPLCASVVVTEVLRPRGAPAAAVAEAFRPIAR